MKKLLLSLSILLFISCSSSDDDSNGKIISIESLNLKKTGVFSNYCEYTGMVTINNPNNYEVTGQVVITFKTIYDDQEGFGFFSSMIVLKANSTNQYEYSFNGSSQSCDTFKYDSVTNVDQTDGVFFKESGK